MPVYEITSFRGGLSDYEDKGIPGAFKFGSNLNIRKQVDSLTCNQALVDEGLVVAGASPSASVSPSASQSPSASPSATPSPSASTSPSSSSSRSPSPSTGTSDSPSASPSASPSPSASTSPSFSISPSPSPSQALTSVFRDLIRFWVKAKDGYTYGFGNTGYIYRRDSDGFYVVVYKDPDGAIKGAAEGYNSDGETYLYWANDTKLKRKDLFGRSDWNDVSTIATNLVSTDWHTICQVGGALMIANGAYLAMVGYDDSYTNEALDLIPGNIAKTIVERNGRTIVGTSRASDPSKSINGAIDTELPLAQVGEDGELYFANMNDAVPIKTFPGGGKVNPGGVANEIEQVAFFEWEQTALSWIAKQLVGNMALFAVYGADTGKGGIYSYGRKNKNHPMTLNLEHLLDADELGALTVVNGTKLVSYRDGTDFGVKATSANSKAEAVYEGLDLKSKVKKSINITNWKTAELFCEPLPTGTKLEFWYKLNKSGEFTQAKNARNETDFQASGETKAVFLVQAAADIFEPRIVLKPTGNTSPEVLRLKIFFD